MPELSGHFSKCVNTVVQWAWARIQLLGPFRQSSVDAISEDLNVFRCCEKFHSLYMEHNRLNVLTLVTEIYS